ncbi:MAG: hypothetical protein ACKVUS_16160 [Saprospiraceae bacterium]
MAFSKLHYLNIGPGGTFAASGNVRSTPADVDELFAHLKTFTQKKLTLYFHGGLVSEASGMGTAEKVYNRFSAGNAGYVYSVVWETGLIETLKERFEKVESTDLFKEIKNIVLRKVCEKLGIEDGGRGGNGTMSKATAAAEMEQERPFLAYEIGARGSADVKSEDELPSTQDEIEAELRMELASDTTLENQLITEAPTAPYFKEEHILEDAPGGRGGVTLIVIARVLAKVAIRAIRRFIQKRDHGVYATCIEEIFREFYVSELGTLVWDGIKDRARKGMWQQNTTAQTGDGQYAGGYFLSKLDGFLAENPGWTIDLIGHSAGSIAICHLLRAIHAKPYTNIKVRNILFMAPAVRTKLFYDEVVTKPERYENVRMFTMTDEAEKEDQLVKFVYTHSLLYLVSGVLENNSGGSESESDDVEKEGDYFVLGMMRYLENRPQYVGSDMLREVRDFFSVEGRLVNSPSKADSILGGKSNALNHSIFDDDNDTMESIIHWINQ